MNIIYCCVCLEDKKEYIFDRSCKCKYDICEDCFIELKHKKCVYCHQLHISQIEKKEFKKSNNLYVPLEFWFSRNENLPLPEIAFSYREVIIEGIN